MLHTIGENADQIWQLLNENGKMQLTELRKISEIGETDFNRSLGWLARDYRIFFYEEDEKQMVSMVY